MSRTPHHQPTPVETVGSNSNVKVCNMESQERRPPCEPNRIRSVATYASPNRFGALALLGSSEITDQAIVTGSPGGLSNHQLTVRLPKLDSAFS